MFDYAPPPWYILTGTWTSGREVTFTTDNPRLADIMIGTLRKSPFTGRVLVTTTYQEPPEERAKREAWQAYLNEAFENV